MMRAVPYFMAMAVLSVALPALAQVQPLPSAPGFPKYIEWPATQNFPSWLSKAFCDRSDADHWVGLVTLYSSSYAS